MSEDLENVDQPDETSVTGRRLSRRTMIAGTAGAAAAMWAAPVVASLAPRAFAQSPVSCQGVPFDCAAPSECGSALGNPCYCGATVDGAFNCWSVVFITTGGCLSDQNCPPPVPGLVPPSHCVEFCGGTVCMATCADADAVGRG